MSAHMIRNKYIRGFVLTSGWGPPIAARRSTKSRAFDWTHTSQVMTEYAHFKFIRGVYNSNFLLFALVKTRDESRWRRSLCPVDVIAVFMRVVVEIIYSTLLTLMIVLDLIISA
jgi:hypothetical protein